jgi:hypothetical protein
MTMTDVQVMDVVFERYDGVRDDLAKRGHFLAEHQAQFDLALEKIVAMFPQDSQDEQTNKALLRTVCHPTILGELERDNGLQPGDLREAADMIERQALLKEGALSWEDFSSGVRSVWDRAMVTKAQHVSDDADRKRRATRMFLYQMEHADNPGLERFGARFHKREGWPIAKLRGLYVSPDGDWWLAADGEPQALGANQSVIEAEELVYLLGRALAAQGLKLPDV